MARWTQDNTEDFTADELAMMNEAQAALEAAFPDADDANIADMLNNAFIPGATVEGLIAAVSARVNG